MNESNPQSLDRTPTATVDSPWLWAAVFLAGAVVALVLTVPKFSWRQPQIERQFQARERSGHAVSGHQGLSPLSTTNHPMLTLKPLLFFFTAALLAVSAWFWCCRLAGLRRLSRAVHSIPEKMEESEESS